jgi:hypothetical protein
MTKLIAA